MSDAKTAAGGSGHLSDSPREWAAEIRANAALLLLQPSAALIAKGLSVSRSPTLQKELWEVIKSQTSLLFTRQAGCDILAALLRYGTMRTCAGVIDALKTSEIFAAFATATSEASSPRGGSSSAGKKQAAAASASASTPSSPFPSAETFARVAPFVEAAAFRVDIEERQHVLGPVVALLSSVLNNNTALLNSSSSSSSNGDFADQLFSPSSNAHRCIHAILAAKEHQVEGVTKFFGDELAKDAAMAGYVAVLAQRSNNSGNGKNTVKLVQRLVEAARESEHPPRAAAVSRAFLDAAQRCCSADLSKVRLQFLNAIVSKQKGCSAMLEIARFVIAHRKQDIIATAFTAERSAQLVAVLLNCLSPAPATAAAAAAQSTDAATTKVARELAALVIAAVNNWPSLISAAQVPQAILGLFLSVKQITQRCPELVASPEMASVVDVATRQYLKQTLSAADVALAAVQMRLAALPSPASASSPTAASATSSKAAAAASSSKLLKVVESDDDEQDDALQTRRRQRDDESKSNATAGSKIKAPGPAAPKNSAQRKK